MSCPPREPVLSGPPPCRAAKWPAVALAVLEPLSVAAFFLYLLNKSWLRWSDPLIDFPRDLYLAWRLSAGDLLYRDVGNWYGPLASLVHGAGFWIFGPGLDTMVWMNLALTVAALLLLRAIFGAIGNRLSVWLGSLVFLGIFVFGNLSDIANYNFFTPYVAQSTYSFLGLLLVLWGVLKHLKTRRPLWLAVAGLGLAVAYLDKPEALFAAAGVLLFYFSTDILRAARSGKNAWRILGQFLAWLAGGFLALGLPVFIYFWSRGGGEFAFGATNRVLATMVDPAIRQAALEGPMMRHYMGTDFPWQNFLLELKSGLLLALVCATMALGAWVWSRAAGFSPLRWIGLLATIAAAAFGGWLGMLSDAWKDLGPALVLPVCGVTLYAVMRSLRVAGRGAEDSSSTLAVAVVGVGASLMLARMILNPMFSHYGFFMMPLAVWFFIHLVAMELPRLVAKRSLGRRNWLLPAVFSLLVLFATGVVVRFELRIYAAKTYEIGVGRDRYYTYQPVKTEAGSLVHMTGVMLDTMIRAYRLKSPQAKSLAVFPEGIAVNYHLRVRSPLAEMEFNPAAIAYAGQQHIIDELRKNPPEVVCQFSRDFSEYGQKYFGVTDASGRGILLWLNDHYDFNVNAGLTASSVTGHIVDLGVRKNLPAQSPPP